METPLCHVCGEPAFVEVLLYDIYIEMPSVKMDRDFTCPFLCVKHMIENEMKASTEVGSYEREVTLGQVADAYANETDLRPPAFSRVLQNACQRPLVQSSDEVLSELQNKINSAVPAIREARGSVVYPYSNRHGAQGFTIYRELPNGHVPESSDEEADQYE